MAEKKNPAQQTKANNLGNMRSYNKTVGDLNNYFKQQLG